ncbi:MAG: DMT family transporter [Saprospiraceae bacterium]
MSKSIRYNQILGVLIALVGSIMFSTKAVFVKFAYQYYQIDSITLLMFRMLFSLPFFLVIATITTRQSDAYQMTRNDYFKILTLGVLGYYLASLFDFIGLQYITASLERLILFTYPTVVVFIGVFYFKEKLSRNQILALLLTYLGIAIVFIGNQSITSRSDLITGSIFVAMSAFFYGVYLAGSGQLIPKIGTWRYTSYALTVSCLSVIIHYLIANQGIGNLTYPYQIYVICLLMATISTVIPTLLVSEGIRRIGASNTSIVGSTGPISTIVLAYIYLGERLTLVQILGAILVLFGVLLISLQKHREQ